jgi:tripartite-type tricarboxylate transporter receptor subunit TctC
MKINGGTTMSRSRTKSATRLLAGMVLACAGSAAMAQAFPSRTIHIVVPYAAGSIPDVNARVVGDKLGQSLGQAIVVDNRPGASGAIAMDSIKKAAPDGHTLMVVDNGPLTVNPNVMRKLSYSPEKDLVPISLLGNAPLVLAVGANSRFRTLAEMIAEAKANPGKISYASAGVGTMHHLGAAMVESGSGTQMLHVPFKDLWQRVAGMTAGDVDWTLTSSNSLTAFLKSGKVRILAAAGRTRLAELPEIPTIAEAGGIPGYELNVWIALMGPRGIPEEVVARLNRDVTRILEHKDVKDRFAAAGLEPAGSTARQLADMIRSDTARFAEVVKRTGISAE